MRDLFEKGNKESSAIGGKGGIERTALWTLDGGNGPRNGISFALHNGRFNIT